MSCIKILCIRRSRELGVPLYVALISLTFLKAVIGNKRGTRVERVASSFAQGLVTRSLHSCRCIKLHKIIDDIRPRVD